MDQVIKTPVTYIYPLAVRIFIPVSPFIPPTIALIENGKEMKPADILLAYIPFLIFSIFLLYYCLRIKITVTDRKLICRRAFSTLTVDIADITVLEITEIMRAETKYRIVTKDGKKIGIPYLISEQGDIIKFIKSIKGIRIKKY